MHRNRKRFGTGGRQNSRYLQSGGRDHARTLQGTDIQDGRHLRGTHHLARTPQRRSGESPARPAQSRPGIAERPGRRHCTRARFALRCEKGAVDGRYDIQPRRWQSVRRTGGIRWSAGGPGSGGISESPCSAETSSGKSWSNAYRPTNGKRRGTARGTPSLIFPAESTASSPGHDTLTAHAHAAWEQQRTECAEPNAKETATKSTVHSGPSLLHRQYRPDPRQAHPFRPTPA